jgi:hypothetical protein
MVWNVTVVCDFEESKQVCKDKMEHDRKKNEVMVIVMVYYEGADRISQQSSLAAAPPIAALDQCKIHDVSPTASAHPPR